VVLNGKSRESRDRFFSTGTERQKIELKNIACDTCATMVVMQNVLTDRTGAPSISTL